MIDTLVAMLPETSRAAIVYPLLAQVLLTFVLMFLMAMQRVKAANARRYKIRDIAVDSGKYPDDVRKFGNSYSNQFELPVLFYLLCILLMLLQPGGNSLYLLLAWAFVVGRYVHAFIHVTSNHVLRRFYAFLVSALVLVLMWALLAFELITSTF